MAISIVKGARVPIHLWAPVHEVQSEALDQLKRVAALPWAFKRVAVMPDVHAGKGCTVGSVIALKDAISPAAVGVDIGCGMSAIKTNLTAEDMPDNLQALYDAIEATIPTGFNSHATPAMKQDGGLFKEFKDLTPEVQDKLGTATNQCGTLGGGNHFIELCFDTDLTSG
jgi:tRNA-splicing ligase RtcB